MPRPAVHPRTLSVAGWGWRHDFPCTAAGPHIFVWVWTQWHCVQLQAPRQYHNIMRMRARVIGDFVLVL